jgi:hypothetical protein
MKFQVVVFWVVTQYNDVGYEGVSESFQTGRLERELQMLQLSATRCSCIAILRVGLVSFAAITLCVASQRVLIVVYFVMTQSGNFWIHARTNVSENHAASYSSLRPRQHGAPKLWYPATSPHDVITEKVTPRVTDYQCYSFTV